MFRAAAVRVRSTASGALALWHAGRKKPLATARVAHGRGAALQDASTARGAGGDDGDEAAEHNPTEVSRWIASVATLPGSDVVASGSCDGMVRLWEARGGEPPAAGAAAAAARAAGGGVAARIGGGGGGERKLAPGLREMACFELPGFVNGLALARSGRFVVAATGQEHRLGRWERVRAARNAVYLVPLPALEAACE